MVLLTNIEKKAVKTIKNILKPKTDTYIPLAF